MWQRCAYLAIGGGGGGVQQWDWAHRVSQLSSQLYQSTYNIWTQLINPTIINSTDLELLDNIVNMVGMEHGTCHVQAFQYTVVTFRPFVH